MPWCPKCGAEYRAGFTKCSTCGAVLTDQPPRDGRPEEEMVLPDGIRRPVVVFTAKTRLEASAVCDYLHEHDIVAFDRPAAFRQTQAYTGADARFGVEIVVDEGQAEAARAQIDALQQALAADPPDEEELSRLAEEQALQSPPQPAEDNAAFRLLPVVLGVIAAALFLLYLVSH